MTARTYAESREFDPAWHGEPADQGRRPQQGLAVRARGRDAARGRLPPAPGPKELALLDDDNGVEFFYLRPRDIAVYVGEGTLDVGITGRDLLLDSGAHADEVMPLGFGRTRFRFAAPPGSDACRGPVARSSARHVATRAWSSATWTSTASAPGSIAPRRRGRDRHPARGRRRDRRRGRDRHHPAQAGSGAVRRADPAVRGGADPPTRRRAAAGSDQLERRLDGVLVARNYVMMDYDVTDDLVEAACAITPGLESPTVSPLAKEGWVAVRAMVPRADAQQIMDDLWALGCPGDPGHRHRRLPHLAS